MTSERLKELLVKAVDNALEESGDEIRELIRITCMTTEDLDGLGYSRAYFESMYAIADELNPVETTCEISVKGLTAKSKGDVDYQGIYLDYTAENGTSIPMVTAEITDETVSLYVYGDINNEDFTDKMEIDLEGLGCDDLITSVSEEVLLDVDSKLFVKRLVAYPSCDEAYPGISLDYQTSDGTLIPLAVIENVDGLVSVYIYGDVNDEDYTYIKKWEVTSLEEFADSKK